MGAPIDPETKTPRSILDLKSQMISTNQAFGELAHRKPSHS